MEISRARNVRLRDIFAGESIARVIQGRRGEGDKVEYISDRSLGRPCEFRARAINMYLCHIAKTRTRQTYVERISFRRSDGSHDKSRLSHALSDFCDRCGIQGRCLYFHNVQTQRSPAFVESVSDE